MINRNVKVVRPAKVELVASDLKTGDLFVMARSVQEPNLLEFVRCAVCLYDDGDDDIRTVYPFAEDKDELEEYNNLAYVSADEPVYRVEIVASELKIVM